MLTDTTYHLDLPTLLQFLRDLKSGAPTVQDLGK